MLRVYDGKRFQLFYSAETKDMSATASEGNVVFNVEDYLFGNSTYLISQTEYASLLKYRKEDNEGICFKHSPKVFSEVRDYLRKIPEKKSRWIFPVVEKNNKLKYMIEYTQNFKMDVYDDYEIDSENLDLEMLDSADVFVFEIFHEYSFACAEVIFRNYSNKKVFFLDKRAAFFFDDVVTNDVELALWKQNYPDKKLMYIYDDSNGQEYSQMDIVRHQIGVNALFKSIFYIQKYATCLKKELWTISFEQTGVQAGLVATLRLLNAFGRYAQKHGLEFKVSEEQFSLYPLSILKKYFNIDYVIERRDEIREDALLIPIDFETLWNGVPQIRRYLFEKDIRFLDYLTADTIALLQSEQKKIIPQNSRVIGFIARGTDYIHAKPKNHPIQMNIREIMPLLKKIMQEDNYEYVFIATEDSDILEYCRQELQERVLYVKQLRVGREELSEGRLLADLLQDLTIQEKEKTMLDYLKAMYCISKCDALITTGGSGTTQLVKYLKEGRYEECIEPYMGVWD